MTARERRALGKYLRWVADAMELRDWTVALAEEPCGDGNHASVYCVSGQRHAIVSVCSDFREQASEEQRETIVHELVHAHFDGCWKMVQSDLAEALGKPVYYVFCDSFRRSMEFAVDGLAKTVAKRLPLIEWPS